MEQAKGHAARKMWVAQVKFHSLEWHVMCKATHLILFRRGTKIIIPVSHLNDVQVHFLCNFHA